MAHKFIIDNRSGQLYTDFSGRRVTTAAEILKAERGLSPTLQVHVVNVATDTRAVTNETISNANVSLVIGEASAVPDKGLLKAQWTVSGSLYESTNLDLQNLTADSLATAFNSAVYPVYIAGGLDIAEIGKGKFLLTMKNTGAVDGTPGLNVEAIDPPSGVEVTTVRTGDSNTRAQYLLSLAKLPVAKIASGSWSSATDGSYTGLSASISLNTTAMLAAISREQREFEISILNGNQVLHRSSVLINESLDPTASGTIVITSPTLFTLGSNAILQSETIALSGGLTYNGTTLSAPHLQLVGGTMSGAIAMGSNKISGLADGTQSGDAVNKGQLDALVDSAPGALNTLNELAAALGDDANFSTTITNSIATKLPKDGSQAMTGALQLIDGSDSAPSLTFSSDTNTGFYKYGTDQIGIATNGTFRAKFSSTGIFEHWTGITLRGGVFKNQDGSDSAPGYTFYDDTDTGIFRPTANNIAITAGGSEVVRFDDNLKTTTKGSVRVNGSTTEGIVVASSSSASQGLKIFNNSSTDDASIINHYSGNLIFGTANTEAARFDSSGKFIAKSIELDSNGADSPTLKVAYDANNYLEFAHNRINGVSSGSHHIAFQTGGTQRARLDSTGLGIGGTPTQKLSVIGGHIELDDNRHIQWGGSNNKITGNDASDYIRVFTAGNEAARFDSSGNFLIGNSATMSVANAQRLVVGDGAGAEGITIYSGSDNAGYLYFADGTSGDQSYRGQINYNQTSDRFTFYTASVERMRLNSTGLGIGVTPSEKLTVDGHIRVGNGTNIYLWNDNNNNYLNYANWVASTGSELTVQNNGSRGIHLKANGANADVVFSAKNGTTLNELMRLDGSASSINVPDNVQLNIGSGIDLIHNSSNGFFKNTVGDLFVENTASGKDTIFKNDNDSGTATELLRLDGSTSSILASGQLTVDVTTAFNTHFKRSGTTRIVGDFSTNDGGWRYTGNGGNDFWVGCATNDFVIRDGNDSATGDLRFKLDATGNVAIGNVASVGEKLVIDSGNIQLTNGNYIIFDGPTPKQTKMRSYYDGSQTHLAMTVTNTAVLDLRADGLSTFSGDVVVGGDLTINGTTTTIDAANLLVEDKNIIIGNVSSPSDTTADGGGITLKGASDYTIAWSNSTDSWHFNQGINLQDDNILTIGSGNDFQVKHTSDNTYIDNTKGNLVITNTDDDTDIIFRNDNGSGSVTEYFRLDGGYGGAGYPTTIFPNDSSLRFGNSGALQIINTGGHSYIQENTGNLHIRNAAADADIVFEADNGDGGGNIETYFYLDGSLSSGEPYTVFPDNSRLAIGSGTDFQMKHNGTDTYLQNYTGHLFLINSSDDKDIYFQTDDGSGGVETYFFLDGSLSTGSPYTVFPDDSVLTFGSGGGDLTIHHDGTDSKIRNQTGDLYITQNTNDGDIIFECDDGSGGVTTYLQLDGGGALTKFLKNTRHEDNVQLNLGTRNDLQLYHDGSNSYVTNATGDMYFINSADDKRIRFASDDGNGGFATYFQLDGSQATYSGGATTGLTTNFGDLSKITLGNSHDMQMWHDGTNSTIYNQTGNLTLDNVTANGDIYLKAYNGSSGSTDYIILDGSQTAIRMKRKVKWDDNIHATFGDGEDLQIYHDGSNSYIRDESGTGDLILSTNAYRLKSANNGETMMTAFEDGAVNLYHNDSSRLSTTSDGISVSGNGYIDLPDNGRARFGAGYDLAIYHDGSHSYLADIGTGALKILGSQIEINNAANSENLATFTEDGAVNLFYDNASRFSTSTDGATITGDLKFDTDIKGLHFAGVGGWDWNILTTDSGASNVPLIIKSKVSGGTSTERMRINSNGAVGINSTSINSGIQLQIGGTTYITNGQLKAHTIQCDYFSNGQGMNLRCGLGSTIHIDGGQRVNIREIDNADHTLDFYDYIVVFKNLAAGRTLTIPTAQHESGREIIIKEKDGYASSNNITIATEGSQTIDGSATATLSTNKGSIRLVCDGTNWLII